MEVGSDVQRDNVQSTKLIVERNMILNYIWIGLILIAVIVGIVQFFAFGQTDIFS